MNDTIESIFLMIDSMMENCTMDYDALNNAIVNASFFEDYNNTRIVNSVNT